MAFSKAAILLQLVCLLGLFGRQTYLSVGLFVSVESLSKVILVRLLFVCSMLSHTFSVISIVTCSYLSFCNLRYSRFVQGSW